MTPELAAYMAANPSLTVIEFDRAAKPTSGPVWAITGPDGTSASHNSFTVTGTLVLRQSKRLLADDGVGMVAPVPHCWLETADQVVPGDDTIPLLPAGQLDATAFGWPLVENDFLGGWICNDALVFDYTALSRLVADPGLQIVSPHRQQLYAGQPACCLVTAAAMSHGTKVTITGTTTSRYTSPAMHFPVTAWLETTDTVTVSQDAADLVGLTS